MIAMGDYFQHQDPYRRDPKAPPWWLIIVCLVWLFATFALIASLGGAGLIFAVLGWLFIAAFFFKPYMDKTDPK